MTENLLPIKIQNTPIVYDLKTRNYEKSTKDYEYINIVDHTEEDYMIVENFIDNLCYYPKIDDEGDYVRQEKEIIINNKGDKRKMIVGVIDQEKTDKLKTLLKLVCGYCITEHTFLKKFFVMSGISSGKSTFFKMFENSMKPYVKTVGFGSLYENNDTFKSYKNLRTGIIHIDDNYATLNKVLLQNSINKIKFCIDSAKGIDGNLYSDKYFMTIPFNVRFSDDCYEPYFDINSKIYKKPKDKNVDNMPYNRKLLSAFVSFCCNCSYEFLNIDNVKEYIERLNNELN